MVPDHIARQACGGDLEEVEKWLDSVAAPRDIVNHVHGDYGETLLTSVTMGDPYTAEHVKLVRRLISLGADVNQIETPQVQLRANT